MREKLINLIKRDALFKKKIKLSSGRMSNYYIDIRRVSLNSEGLYLITHLMWNMIKDDGATAIGGPTMGADPIVGGICFLSYQENRIIKGFIIRKQPKKHGRQNLIEGKELDVNDEAVIIDDVTTTGSSLVNACLALRKYGVNVIKAAAVVDRNEGAKEAFSELKVPFVSLFTVNDLL